MLANGASREAAVFGVSDLAPIVDAVGFRLRAVGEDVPQLGQFHVAVFLDELGNVAPEPAAGLALNRERGRAEVRQCVGVVAHGVALASAEALNLEPDLHEQVANDPSVQAAKQAYEAPYAKALAEAGGKI